MDICFYLGCIFIIWSRIYLLISQLYFSNLMTEKMLANLEQIMEPLFHYSSSNFRKSTSTAAIPSDKFLSCLNRRVKLREIYDRLFTRRCVLAVVQHW